jgi:Na+-transporting NADH:ubiquinone oxidoreductase subunit C
MSQQFSTTRILGFATLTCVICGFFVASAAVALKERQVKNEELDRKKQVLVVAGIDLAAGSVDELFASYIKPTLVDLVPNGCQGEDSAKFDQMKAVKDPTKSHVAPANKAKVQTMPNCASVYQVLSKADKSVESYILPIEGKGLWSTLYGFIAIDKTISEVTGITFYKHAETPGLGGEVDNAKWKASWKGKKPFDDQFNVLLKVVKGKSQTNSQIDGLSVATLTSNGVSYLISYWLGNDGFGPYLKRLKK